MAVVRISLVLLAAATRASANTAGAGCKDDPTYLRGGWSWCCRRRCRTDRPFRLLRRSKQNRTPYLSEPAPNQTGAQQAETAETAQLDALEHGGAWVCLMSGTQYWYHSLFSESQFSSSAILTGTKIQKPPGYDCAYTVYAQS